MIFSRDTQDVKDVEIHPPVGKSHHALIVCNLVIDDLRDDIEMPTYRYNFHKANFVEIRRELSEINWQVLFADKNVEEMYQILVNILCDLIDKYVPLIRCTKGKRKPKWMTKEVSNQISAKEKAWKRLKARKTPKRIQEYHRIRNETTSMIRQVKKAFIKKLCEDIKVNPKHFWSYVRS